MAFWKRKKEPEFISLGLNRAATAEEEAIAARRDEGPEPEFFEKFAEAVASTRENLADRIDLVIGGRREIDAAVLDELEEVLIGADIGAQTSLAIIEKARQQLNRKQLRDFDELKRLIKSELRDILDTAERNRPRGTVASETEVPL
ncbi:MAG TPA: signal recognition particle receptor subunit alpha, partial [Blastocatellia bacterium]|nr:signal recognition particle receptor subunit alpha [Blastocatellia bacterium]